MSESTSPASPRKRASGLNRTVILDACLRLSAAHEGDPLTFRRIGRELGADPTALYRHFADKDELLLALADRLLAEVMDGYSPASHWREALGDLLARVRAKFLDYPHIATLAALRVTRQEGELRFVEAMLGILESAGFDPDAAARYHRSCADFMLAWSGFGAGLKILGEKSAADDMAWVSSYSRLPRGSSPLAMRAVGIMAAISDDESFTLALELLLDGIEVRAGA
ncbi:TetR/AcrR family transcriptional regulator [Paeniglutamicibacter cryotolerans]|uniref:AcrR family transcriptional regulator n=1 Tax=Paeniglutamicibacter cryotolerans TaxID=670079 RepID=A0A839QFG6_9MICC|nr:TetR/AcrR family transcriptional regulator [Paeniglutamicibacter cryotolerans]MBB2994363.1 AcrR family transcriptional regulator [Paeniglutamicibacter cryotolerans]